MKLDASKFFVENKVLSASEQGVVYDLPRDKIQEAWDKLSARYIEKSREEHKSDILAEEFYRVLVQARVENETALETFELVNKGVITCYEATESKEQKFNIKRLIIGEVLKIFKRRVSELVDNIEREQATYSQMKTINANIKIVDGGLKVYTDPFNFISFEQVLENREKKIGLHCTVRYRNLVYAGYFEAQTDKLFSISPSLLGVFKEGALEIETKPEPSEDAHPVCTAVVRELLAGRTIKEVLPNMMVLLSKFHMDELVGDSEKTVVKTGTPVMSDGLPSVFYAVTDSSVVKVVRSRDSFEIYRNGVKLYG